jgi:hypothetical protein
MDWVDTCVGGVSGVARYRYPCCQGQGGGGAEVETYQGHKRSSTTLKFVVMSALNVTKPR